MQFLGFGEKRNFSVLAGKHNFSVLVEKHNFSDFGGKTQFLGFGKKTQFLGFGGENAISRCWREKHNFSVLGGNAISRFWWENAISRFWRENAIKEICIIFLSSNHNKIVKSYLVMSLRENLMMNMILKITPSV